MQGKATHDLIVVGAGPSGAAAARVAAGADLRVALVDKARFPRDKLCGGGVTGRAMGQLRAVFGDAVAETLFHPCREVRLLAGTRVLGVETGVPLIGMVMRREFDAALKAAAIAAGAEDYSGQRIEVLEPDPPMLRLTGGAELRAPLLIGADGINSQVARALFGRAHDPKRVAFALEAEVAGETSGHLELDLAALNWGYGWDFPKAGGRTLGIGGIGVLNPDLKARFAEWLGARGVAAEGLRIKGHHLPMGEFRQMPGRGRVLLVGDAAGFVDPITGEGIGWALHSGRIAGEAAVLALTAGQPEAALADYRGRAVHMLGELGRARFLARMVYHPMLRGRFQRLLERSPGTRRRFMELLAGDLDYADIGPARVVRLLWRLLTGRGREASG